MLPRYPCNIDYLVAVEWTLLEIPMLSPWAVASYRAEEKTAQWAATAWGRWKADRVKWAVD